MSSRPAPAWVIGVALVVLIAIASCATAWLVWDRAEDKARVESERAAQATREALQTSLGRVLTTLRGADGLVDERGIVDPVSFQAFSRAVGSVQSGGSLAYEKIVSAEDRTAFEATFGRPIVEFVRTGVFRRAAGRSAYLPIVAVWPETPANTGLLGLDILSEPARRRTLALAQRTHHAVFTDLIPLARGSQGLIAFKPLYAAGSAAGSVPPVGFVSVSFSTSLIGEVLDGLPDEVRSRVSVGGTRVFETADPPRDAVRRGLLLGERRWVVEASGEGPSMAAPLGVLAGGLALAGLVALFALSRVSFERRLVDVNEAEREARERAELLERHAAHLAAALGVQDVAAVTVADLASAGVDVAVVNVLRGDRVEMAASHGISQEALAEMRSQRIDDAETLGAHAIRTGAIAETATGREYDERFPSRAAGRQSDGIESVIAMPLRDADGAVIGSLVAASRKPENVDPRLRLLLTGLAEQCALALERARLQSLERDARKRTMILQHLAARLSAAARPADVAEATVPALVDAFDADVCLVGVSSGVELAVLWSTHGDGEEEQAWIAASRTTPTIVASAVGGSPVERHGRAQLENADDEALARLQAAGVESVVLVPLANAAGCVGVGFRTARVLSTVEREMLEAIAEDLAQALERATLFEGERGARRRAELMERNAAHLAAASTVTEVAQATVADVEAFGADVAYVWRLEGGERLALLARSDVPSETQGKFDTYALDDPGIVGDALRLGDFDHVATAEEYDERFPSLAPERQRLGLESLAAVPLRAASGEVVGALFAASTRRRWFDEGRRQLVCGIAEQNGVALERARLFETEREARRLAELLEENAAHLAAATDVYEVASSCVGDLERAGIGRATVHVVRDETIELLAAAAMPEAAVEAYRLQALDSQTIAGDVIRSGTTIEVPTRRELDERYPESALLHRELDAESAIAVPLKSASGRVFGLLRVTSTEEGWLTTSRRQVILGLAEQCGVALERAALQADAERAAATAGFLAALGEALERSPTVRARARRLTEFLTLERATFAVVHLFDEDGTLRLEAESGSRPAETEDDDSWLRLAERAMRRSRSVPQGAATTPAAMPSLHVLPLRARGHTIGALTVRATADSRWEPMISPDLAREVASRAAVALDNALLYERERDVSHSLQLGLLGGGLPSFDGVVVTAAYRPGTAALEVGGDWYDAFRLPSGSIALVVGDVVGHGLEAAVAMGQLRGAVSALAQAMGPARLLEHLDAFVENVPAAATATVSYVELDATTGRLRYACAGHPPPLVVSPDGRTRFLWDGRSAPLGSMLGEPRSDAHERLADGETLVLYTDGLVERRSESLDAGFARLAAAARLQGRTSLALADDIGTALLEGQTQDDDVCVLTVHRVSATEIYSDSFPASPAELAGLRERLRAWLDERALDEEAIRSTVLAVSEAAANAIEHGYDSDPSGVVTVMARLDGDDTLRLSVRDEGTWRSRAGNEDRGRGLPIIRAIVDELSVDRTEEETVVRMARSTRSKVSA